MCRSLILLQNIENVSIDELLCFMKRRLKLYAIFFVIEIVTFILANDYHTTFVAFSIVTLVLYILSMLAIFQFLKNPTSGNVFYPGLMAVMVLLFNIFDMVYTLIKAHNLWALITLISIALQLSTLAILYKLREKLINRELGHEEDDVQLEQPIENSSTHSSKHNSTHLSINSTHSQSNGSTHGSPHPRTVPDIENPMGRG